MTTESIHGPLIELIKSSYRDGYCDKKGKRTTHPSGLIWQMNIATAGRIPTDPPSLRTVALIQIDKRKGLLFVTLDGIGGSRSSNSTVPVASVNIHGTTLPPSEEEWRFEGIVVADPSALSHVPHSLLGNHYDIDNLLYHHLNHTFTLSQLTCLHVPMKGKGKR
jgi:hypothetical protein